MGIQSPKSVTSNNMLVASIKRYYEAKQIAASSPTPVNEMSASNCVGTMTDSPLDNNYYEGGDILKPEEQKKEEKKLSLLLTYNNTVVASEIFDISETVSQNVSSYNISSYSKGTSSYEAVADLLNSVNYDGD